MSIAVRFSSINDPSQLIVLLLREIDVPARPILLKSLWLCGTRNSNHALSSNPSKRNLRQRAALLLGKFLDILKNSTIFVERLALEFRHCSTQVVGREVIWRSVREVFDKPALAQRAVCDVRYAKLFGCFDQVVGFVDGFEGRVFGLYGIDLGDWRLSVRGKAWVA